MPSAAYRAGAHVGVRFPSFNHAAPFFLASYLPRCPLLLTVPPSNNTWLACGVYLVLVLTDRGNFLSRYPDRHLRYRGLIGGLAVYNELRHMTGG